MKYGLKMNVSKTKVVMKPLVPDGEIIINGNQIEEVEEYINLGESFRLKEKNQEQEIKRTLKLGRKQYGKLGNIRRGSLPICLKRKKKLIHDNIPTIISGAETWALTAKLEKRLTAAQHNTSSQFHQKRSAKISKEQDTIVGLQCTNTSHLAMHVCDSSGAMNTGNGLPSSG